MTRSVIFVCMASTALLFAAHNVYAQSSGPTPPGDGDSPVHACVDGKVQVVRSDGRMACVYPGTAERLELRGWIVQSAEDGSTTGPAGEAQSTGSAGGGYADYYDEALYYVADGRLTLEGLEQLPNSEGFWNPYTREYAEEVLMPRLAGAIGDRVILPVGSQGRATDQYYTEQDNMFLVTHEWDRNLDIIYHTKYRITQYISNPYDLEDFVRSFAENAGFEIGRVNLGRDSVTAYSAGNAGSIDAYNAPFFGHESFTDISVYRWSSDPDLGSSSLVSNEELKRRAYDFASRHTDIYHEDACRFELLDWEDVTIVGDLQVGVPISEVKVGKCYYPPYEHWTPRQMEIYIDRATGEIMWPSDVRYLVDDWFDRIKHDVPESAWVTTGGGM